MTARRASSLAVLALLGSLAIAQPINTSAPRGRAEPDAAEIHAASHRIVVPGDDAPPPGDPAFDPFTETPAQRDARMAWWREARFGMFIHWGLYAIPAGQWGEATHHAEWIRTTAQIPLETYDQFLARFNPVKFDAAAWARMAREAGMRYIVITSKHHDGFCLWDSAVTDFDVMSTPFKRDILRELCDAARAEGLQICFYHSIMDWHHPDYLPRRSWETDRSAEGADFDRFVEYLHAQVTELLTNYGPIGVLWFDGEWEDTWTEAHGRELYALCRRLQPGIIVNNRVAKARDGMAGLSLEGQFAGDFGTPEQEVPATGLPGVDWESCMTMNDHWGYNAFDTRWKSTTELIRTLVDIASKGGNFLLNVGPRADGTFPPEAVDRLREIGGWMGRHPDAIHQTSASPFEQLPWGRCTVGRAESPRLTALFLHVFEQPENGRIVVPGLQARYVDVQYLVHRAARVYGEGVSAERSGADLIISGVGATGREPTVIELMVDPQYSVFHRPVFVAQSPQFTESLTVALSHPRAPEFEATDNPLDLRYTLDNSDPTATSPAYDGPLVLRDTTTVRVQAYRGPTPLSPIAAQTFEKVTPLPGVALDNPQLGLLRCVHYQGTWDRMPRFDTLTPVKTDQPQGLTLDTRTRDEHIAMRFTGFLYVKAAGLYRFALTSDDGSRLYFHDRLVVDNDGLHVAESREGTIALGVGWHPITVEYFNRSGGYSLGLRGEMVGNAMLDIPARAFAAPAGP